MPRATIRAYVGEGETTRDPITTFGGYGVARIPRLQDLLRHICARRVRASRGDQSSRVGGSSRRPSRYLDGTCTITTARRPLARSHLGSAGRQRSNRSARASGGKPPRGRAGRQEGTPHPVAEGMMSRADHRHRLRHGLRARGGHRRAVGQGAGERGRLVHALGGREILRSREEHVPPASAGLHRGHGVLR